jgi:UDP-perosamine 4-acetyltransferase
MRRDQRSLSMHRVGTMTRRLMIVGAGDHGRVLADIARNTGWERIGFVEPAMPEDTSRARAAPPIEGDLDHPNDWLRGVDAFAVGLGDNRRRAQSWERCLELGLTPATLLHPSAILLGGAKLEEGAQVCAGAVVGIDAVVAGNAIINTAASIDHDVRVALHAQIGPGCHLAGRVVVAEGAFVGTGATITPGRTIGAWATVGAGAAVIDDIAEGATVGGVPARSLDPPLG